MQRGEYQAGLLAYRSALALSRRISDRDLTTPNWRSRIATCQTLIGNAHSELNEYSPALAAYRLSGDTYRELIARDPTNMKWPRLLAQSQLVTAEVQQRSGAFAAASASFESARDTVQQLIDRDPHDANTQRLLHFILLGEGYLDWARGDEQSALDAYVASAAVLEPLLQRDPDDLVSRNFLASAHALIGQTYGELKKPAKARQEWALAVDLLKPVAAKDSGRIFVVSYAWALLGLGQIEEAKPIVAQAATLDGLDPRFVALIERNGFRYSGRPVILPGPKTN